MPSPARTIDQPDPPAPRQPKPFTTLEIVALVGALRTLPYPNNSAMYVARRDAFKKLSDALGVG